MMRLCVRDGKPFQGVDQLDGVIARAVCRWNELNNKAQASLLTRRDKLNTSSHNSISTLGRVSLGATGRENAKAEYLPRRLFRERELVRKM